MAVKKTNPKDLRTRRFKLLNDENRLQIIELLFAGPVNVSEITSTLGIEQSLTSHHLGVLRKEGILISERRGKEIFYQLADEVRANCDKRELELRCCKILLRSTV